MICVVCKNEILPEDSITCATCKIEYHCPCLNMNDIPFGDRFKCDSCCNITHRVRVTDDTPIRSRGTYGGNDVKSMIKNTKESLPSPNILPDSMVKIMEMFTGVITDKIKIMETNLLQELKVSVTALALENSVLKQELCEANKKCVTFQKEIHSLKKKVENNQEFINSEPVVNHKRISRQNILSPSIEAPLSLIDPGSKSPESKDLLADSSSPWVQPTQPAQPTQPNVSYAAVARKTAITQQNDQPWIEVTKNKMRNHIIKGGNASMVSLKAVERKKYLHIWRLNKSTTEDILKEHITGILNHGSELSIQKLTPKTERDYVSFKIGVSESNFKKLLNPDIWPLNVEICEWIWFRTSTKHNQP